MGFEGLQEEYDGKNRNKIMDLATWVVVTLLTEAKGKA